LVLTGVPETDRWQDRRMATPLATSVRARALGTALPTVLAGLLLLGTGTASAAPPAAPSPAAPAGSSAAGLAALDPTNRASVAAAYRDVYLPALAVKAPAVPAGAAAKCAAGEAPAALADANRDLVNFFRTLSGVAPVAFDKELSRKAQQAALISFANNSLNHFPGLDAKCFTVDGAEAASNSNLGRNYAGADVIRAYMDESGAANVAVPHRWWLQRPAVRTMGSGSVGTFNALWVNGATAGAAAPAYTSWPAAGYLPGSLEPKGRWSFTTWEAGTSLQNAKVAVTRADGSTVKATTRPVGGYDSLVFELGDLPEPTGGKTDTYTVTVSGIQQGGRAVAPYRYAVHLFDPGTQVAVDAPPAPPVLSGRTLVGSVLEARPNGGSVTGYQWFRGDTAIAGATSATLKLGAADVGSRLRVAVTQTVAGKAVTTRSAPSAVVQVPSSVAVTATPAGPGALRLAVSATAAGEVTDGGAVEVLEGSTVVQKGVRLRSGGATVDLTGLKPGVHTYTVRYAGTARVASSTSSVQATVRDRAAAKLTTTATSSAVGKLALTVKVTAPGESGIGGTVSVKEGTKTLRSGLAVKNGVVTWSASGLKSGKHTYTLVYSGTSRVKNASATVAATVRAKVKPALTLKASSSAKGKVSVTVTVKASGQSNLGGTVSVKEGSKTLKSKIKVSKGKASWSATRVKSAKHTYTVSYSGTSQVFSRSAKVSVRVK
jgi:Big-like domain-containing protein/cysteine-rich secretory family protein